MIRCLDLFSGIGGFSLGLEATGCFETVAFCEIDPFCQKVLKKHWPEIPIYDDVRTIDPTGLGRIDLICGGYPCQPFSTAGKRGGENDDRHLWPAMFDLIASVRPRWVIAENVAGHISMGLDAVLSDLESEGYTWWTFVLPACAVDARHRRDRVWIVAHADSGHGRELRCGSTGQQSAEKKRSSENDDAAPSSDRPEVLAHSDSQREPQQEGTERNIGGRAINSGKVLADSESGRVEGNRAAREQESRTQAGTGLPGRDCAGHGAEIGAIKPGMGGAAHGFSFELDADRLGTPRISREVKHRAKRLKALGNAVVPQIPFVIGRYISVVEST